MVGMVERIELSDLIRWLVTLIHLRKVRHCYTYLISSLISGTEVAEKPQLSPVNRGPRKRMQLESTSRLTLNPPGRNIVYKLWT